MPQIFANAARAKLTAAINAAATSIQIDAGALFPVANTGTSEVGDGADWFKAVLQSETAFEVIYVRTHTSASSTLSNVLRGQEGTTAASFAIDDIVGIRPLASDAYAAAYQRTPRTTHTGSAIIPGGNTAQRDTSPAAGYFRYNSDLQAHESYNGTAWVTIGSASVIEAVVEFTATAGQTTITTAYTPGQVSVYRNGARLAPADITATNGTSITIPAAGLNDSLVVVKHLAASLANAVAKSGDTMSGPLNVPAGASGTQTPQAQEVAALARSAIAMGAVLTVANNGATLAAWTEHPINAASGSFAVSLPAAAANDRIKLRNYGNSWSSANAVTVNVPASSVLYILGRTVTGPDTLVLNTSDVQELTLLLTHINAGTRYWSAS